MHNAESEKGAPTTRCGPVRIPPTSALVSDADEEVSGSFPSPYFSPRYSIIYYYLAHSMSGRA